MEIGTIFWLLHGKIRPINTMDREKVSELIHNAESQATRMAENGATIIFNIQIAGGWKIEKM